MTERTFGRLAAEDERDRMFQLRVPAAATTQRFAYWSDHTYFGDQLNTPHCVGYAWTHWLCNAPISNYLDPDGIYELAQHIDEWDGTQYFGTSVRAGAKVLHKLGLIERYEWCWDVETLIEAVLSRGPVIVGTDWHRSMDTADENGIIKVAGRSIGGHAYLINGVSRDRGFFRIKNSWGRQWAAEGRAWISFEDMDKLITAEGEVCLAVERLAKPPELSRSSIQKKGADVSAPEPEPEPEGVIAQPRTEPKHGPPRPRRKQRDRKRLSE